MYFCPTEAPSSSFPL